MAELETRAVPKSTCVMTLHVVKVYVNNVFENKI